MKPYMQAKRDFASDYFRAVLVHCNGRTCAAARVAGMSVPNFCKYLREHGLRAGDFRRAA